jgi:hypothetical protein
MRARLKPDFTSQRRLLAALCVVVVAVFGFVQAVHVHDGLAANESPNAPSTHCLICVAAHSAPVVTAISFAPALAISASVTPVLAPQLQSQQAVASSFIRPPPVSL